jgi:hypothetical protein
MLPVSRPCQPIGCRTRSGGSASPALRATPSPPSSGRLPTVGSARRKSHATQERAIDRFVLGPAEKSGDPAARPDWRPRVNGLDSLAARQGSRFARTCLRCRERGPIRSLGPLVLAAFGRFTRGSEGASKCVGMRDQSRERGRRSSERRPERAVCRSARRDRCAAMRFW